MSKRVPTQARTHGSAARSAEKWIPACVGIACGPRSGLGDSGMQCGQAMPVGVRLMHQFVSRVDNTLPLGRIAEPRQRLGRVAEIWIEGDVMPVGIEDVVVPAPDQDLAGAGRRR